MAFLVKSVHQEGYIGADLAELRERAGLSLVDVAQRTKIAESLIRAWEEERWEDVQDPIYSERIFRSYVHFLGGSEAYYLHKYRECLFERHVERKPEDLLPRPRRIHMGDLLVGSRLIAFAGFSLFVALLGGYVFYQARGISAPPPLLVDSPVEGQTLDNPIVLVHGKTLAEASVTINGLVAVVEPDGQFKMTLSVPRGTSVVTIAARKRHGREAQMIRHVIYERSLPDLTEPFTTSTIIAP